jgi:hypothetical protein
MATLMARRAAPETVAAEAPLTSRHRLLLPSRGYAVTHNPFAVWEVLPTITLAFAGMAIAARYLDSYTAPIAVGAFLVVTLGMLLVSAVTLNGTLNVTHEGIIFARGKDHLTASWDQVVGIENRRTSGLTLIINNPEQTRERLRLPGGFSSEKGVAAIPLRMFGDRRFSILYDIRDRLPEAAWRPALEAADNRSTLNILMVYGGVVAFSGLAMWAVLNTVS